MKKALWVTRDRTQSMRAIDDLLADASARGIFDLVVQVEGPEALDHLVRFGAATGVRIHAWVDPASAEAVVARHHVEGIHYDWRAGAVDAESIQRVRHARPSIVISALVSPEPAAAREAQGKVDVLCPMTDTPDPSEVERRLGLARSAAPLAEMWAGLVAHRRERETLREQVRAAARAGCEGAILFAYDPDTPDLLDIFAAA